ncbi:MAG TPA: Ger(x)C family spore germination protein [Bacillota bacterium]|nr:Ger(x)C family spore germination protein [Bacillota bacterium]
MNRKIGLLLLFISLGLLPGCWDLQEVDKLSFATTVGIDSGPGNSISLSLQAPITQAALPPVVGGGKQEKKFYLLNQTAKTVARAFDYLEAQTDRSLILNQTKSVIFGETVARRDIQPVLDHLVRTVQTPLSCYVFIADGIAAAEILKLDPAQNILPGMMFVSAGQSNSKYDMTYFIPLWQFQQKLIHESKDTFAPLISVDAERRIYVISGLAVFCGNRMTGKLSGEEVEVFGLATGIKKAGVMAFSVPDGEVALRHVHGNSRINVKLQQGKPFFEIETNVQGSVSELTTPNMLLSPQRINRYQKIIARSIEARMTDLVKKLQGYNSDIINFGEEFRVQHQKAWKKTDWRKVYPVVPFTVKAKVKILSDGRFR